MGRPFFPVPVHNRILDGGDGGDGDGGGRGGRRKDDSSDVLQGWSIPTTTDVVLDGCGCSLCLGAAYTKFTTMNSLGLGHTLYGTPWRYLLFLTHSLPSLLYMDFYS